MKVMGRKGEEEKGRRGEGEIRCWVLGTGYLVVGKPEHRTRHPEPRTQNHTYVNKLTLLIFIILTV
jgi:hypothetical protein